eukprot:6476862-Amphidinium_carterae.1
MGKCEGHSIECHSPLDRLDVWRLGGWELSIKIREVVQYKDACQSLLCSKSSCLQQHTLIMSVEQGKGAAIHQDRQPWVNLGWALGHVEAPRWGLEGIVLTLADGAAYL